MGPPLPPPDVTWPIGVPRSPYWGFPFAYWGFPIAIGRSRLWIGRSRLLLGVLGYGSGVDACFLVHCSWLKAHGSWPREARGGSWLIAHGSWPRGAGPTLTPEGAPGPDPAGPGAPSGPRAGPAPLGHEP